MTSKDTNTSILLMPTSAIAKFYGEMSSFERNALEEATAILAKTHPFIGGLIFERNPKQLKDEHGIRPKGLQLINIFLKRYGFSIGQESNYNKRTDLAEIMKKPLTSDHGTARRDKYRDKLIGLIPELKKEPQNLELARAASLDSYGQLSIAFNLSADLADTIKKSELTNDEIANGINGSLKRVIRRAFLKENRMDIPTDSEMASRYDADGASRISVADGVISVTIPLSRIVKGSFQQGISTSQHIESGMAQEIIYGIKLAAAAKAGPKLL